MLIVEGPSGVGKSRLIAEALERLGNDTRVLSIRCLDSEVERYEPLVQGLAQLRGSFAGGIDRASATGFEQGLLRELQLEVDRGLAVIAVDDLQWADAGTIAVLIRFLDGLPPSARSPIVFATLRTDDDQNAPHLPALLRHPAATRLHLEGLTASEGAELLVALGAPLRLADTFAEIVALVDGNPLLLEEMAVQLIRLAPADPDTVLRSLDVPGSVAAEADRRVAATSDAMQTLLAAVALAPNQPLSVIIAVVDALVDDVDADDLADDAEDLGLLQINADAVAPTHPSLRQATLKSTRASKRRHIHRQLGAQLLREGSNGDPIDVVRHLVAGRVPPDDTTTSLAERALRHAMDRHDWRNAVSIAHYLLPGASTNEIGLHQLSLGIAHFMLGEAEEARQVLAAAKQSTRLAGDLAGEVWATLGLSRAFGTFVALGVAEEDDGFEALLARIPMTERMLRSEVLADMAFSSWILGDYSTARAQADDALAAAPTDAINARVRALTCLGLVDYVECRIDNALASIREAEGLCNLADDPLVAVAPAVREPYLLMAAGRVDEARRRAAGVLDRLASMRFTSQMAFPAAMLVVGATVQADVAEAERSWRSLQHWAAETGEIVATATAGIALCIGLGGMGRPERALDVAREALTPLAGPDALQSPLGIPLVDWVEHENPARPIRSITGPKPMRPRVDLLSLSRACLAVEQARMAAVDVPEGVVETLEEALRRGCQLSTAPPMLVMRSLGRAQAIGGNQAEAATSLAKAAEQARRSGMPMELARTQLDRLETGAIDAALIDGATDELTDLVVAHRMLGLLERLETIDGRAAARVRTALRNEHAPIEPGTAVVMMADIVSSTALTRSLGEVDYRHQARLVERIVREGVAAHGGRTVEGVKLGDGALAEFGDVDSAVRAAVAINETLGSGTLKLRIGINVGPVVREGSELFGSAINLAARTCDAAEPGSVMMTGAAAEQFDGAWLGALVEQGEFMMKGIDEPVRLYEPVTAEALAKVVIEPESATVAAASH